MSTASGNLRNIALRRKGAAGRAPEPSDDPARASGAASASATAPGQVVMRRSDATVAVRTLALLYWRNLRQMPRMPAVLVFGIIMPIIQLALFGSIFSSLGDIPGLLPDGVGYIAYITPAIVLLTGILGMANMSAALLVDLRSGYFDKLRTTPATPWGIILARMGPDMTRVMGQAFLVLIVAVLLGEGVSTGILGAVAMVALTVLFAGCTVGLIVSALAMKTKSDQATQSFFPLFFLLIFLSSAYMPRENLPDWLQTLAVFNPLEYVIVTLQDLMFRNVWPVESIAVVLGASVVAALILSYVNVKVYRKMAG